MIVQDGLDLLRRTADHVRVHSTGLETVDQLLGGGLRDEQVIEVAGPCCTGKTQICLSLAANLLLKGEHVHWIDMADGFSATKLHQILRSRISERVLDLMKRLTVCNVGNVLQLFHLLHRDLQNKPAVYIVDGLGPTLQALRDGSTHHHQGRALILEIGKRLKWVARRHGCAVITTNAIDGMIRPTGTLAWNRGPHYRLIMQARDGEGGEGDKKIIEASLQASTFIRPEISNSTTRIGISVAGPSLAPQNDPS